MTCPRPDADECTDQTPCSGCQAEAACFVTEGETVDETASGPYDRSHDMFVDEDGAVDVFRLDVDFHNGPECRRCGRWCEHCEPGRAAASCQGRNEEQPC